ncbi:MAG: DUF1576 domain-containing protein [Clostridia bacterium]|nr:DUF1576 domain-containing protein [Clostridia bacterium]
MTERLANLKPRQHIYNLFLFTIIAMYIAAFIFATPMEIIEGMLAIIRTRDVLITDYMSVAGVGAALFNSALVMTMSLYIVMRLKLNFTGTTIAAIYIMGGFALFGKNPLNILPILFGAYLYSRAQGVALTRYAYIALFGTGLSPLVTEMGRLLPFSPFIRTLCGILIGVIAGFIIPSLATHTVSMHQGYSLFNVGFAAGIIALCIVSFLRSLGFSISTTLVWHGARHPVWFICLFLYFAAVFVYGLVISRFDIKKFFHLLRHPGRAVADFIIMDGAGPTFMNMGACGIICLLYIYIIGGQLSGPVIGAILTIFGFASFGIHVKNFPPVLVGVYIFTLFSSFRATDPATQLAAIFSACLAPISGQYGHLAGVVAGILHASVVSYIGSVYGGMNLYNNGFAAGFVAIIMVPVMESFIKRYK